MKSKICFKFSKGAYDPKLYLAHCRLASHSGCAVHEMISPSLPISLVMRLGNKKQGQWARCHAWVSAVWGDYMDEKI